MEKHKTGWAKVNVPVDKGVEKIVSALSKFCFLETIESCEGNDTSGPWVCFRYGSYWDNPWYDLAYFVLDYLVPGLSKLVGDDAIVTIRSTPSDNIYGELSIRHGAASRVEAAIRTLAQHWFIEGQKFR